MARDQASVTNRIWGVQLKPHLPVCRGIQQVALYKLPLQRLLELHYKQVTWCRRGIVVTALVVSTKLLYVKPG